MKRVVVLLAVSLLVAACDQEITTPAAPDLSNPEISDHYHNGGVQGFYFLSPIVPEPVAMGTFNPLVRPRVVICEFDETNDVCVATVAEYTLTSGTDGATLSMSTTDEHYRVNWNTKNYDLDTSATYRIVVFLTVYPGALRLGHADVQLGANKGELRNVDTNEYITLVDNQTLPIKFRIENGAGCEGELDCGSGTVGTDGGIVTTANGAAGVSVPAGAVDNPITITIRQLDPAEQPGGLCLPTGIRQDGACYDFDTVEEISDVQDDESDTFNELVTVAICPSPNAVRPERLTLHKYNPERYDTEGVVELENASETFLECENLTGPGYAAADASFFGRLAGVARRALSPVASVLFPEDLHATDIGRAGLTDSFSRITWAESIDLAYSSVPGSATPGAEIGLTVTAATAHNHDQPGPVPGTDAQLRFDYIDPNGDGALADPYLTTNGNGEVAFSWALTAATGVHTLVISSRDTDPSIAGDPLIEDPTGVQTVQLVVCGEGLDCGLGTVDGDGGEVTTDDGFAGVFVPQGAVLVPVTIVITEQDVSTLPGGRCLPTGIRQDGACYDFDTLEEISDVTGGSENFLEPVTVAICPSENALREAYLTLHKYNPERSDEGVVELDGAEETFLDCPIDDGPIIGGTPSGFFGRIASAAGRALSPVASLIAPRTLYATDIGRAGLTDSFSRISWAESLTLSAAEFPSTAVAGDVLTGTVTGTTAHNHGDNAPTAATDAQLRFDYTDPAGFTDSWNATTDAQGAALSWQLTQAPGTHTLVISSRDVDPLLPGSPLIEDQTPHEVLEVLVGSDLVVSQMTSSPTDPTTAQDVEFTATVENIGTGSAPASTLMFKLGGETPGAPATLFDVPELQPGETFTQARTLSAPLVAQAYINTATADYDEEVAESNEQNNTATHNWTAVAPDGSATDETGDSGSGPDLTFASAAVSGTSLVLTVQLEGNRVEEQAETWVEWVLDMDENPLTGHPGVNAGGGDSDKIGAEYLISINGDLTVTLWTWNGSGFNTTALAVNPAITDSATGWSYQISVPLSSLGGDDGRLRFKAVSATDNGDGSLSGVTDYLTDLESAEVIVH